VLVLTRWLVGEVDERLKCYACGEVHSSARIVRTVDGREMGSHTQEWFLYNEAAWVLKKFRSKRTRQEYLQRVRGHRGEAGMEQLRAEMLLQWQWKQEQKK
jgi:hypothetical protein